jgi:Tol biopolymer transport system component
MRKLAAAVVLMLSVNGPAAQGPSCATEDFPLLEGSYLGQKPPANLPELFGPGFVSTCREHSAAMFTPDGSEIWFGRMFPATIYCMKKENGRWTEPRPAPFSSGHDDLYPQLSPDGNRLVFTSTRPPRESDAVLPRGRGQLWMVERAGDDWSDPRHLGPAINFGRRHGGGSFSPSGTLYYNASGDGSGGIYRSVETDVGFSSPERVDALNSDAPDHCPFVAPDGSYIIISSFRGGFGLSDLFISFRREDGGWTEPRNMGSRINSAAKDEYPYVTPDGKYLFFNSNRISSLNPSRIPDGPGNIYWVDAGIIDELRP